LYRIVKTGLDNPTSGLGCYAMNPKDYDEFPLLARVTDDYHKVPAGVKQHNDWTVTGDLDITKIEPNLKDISMRVRVARNLATFPLPGAMTREKRVELELFMSDKVFSKLIANPNYGGHYHSLTPGHKNKITDQHYQQLVDAHQMFKDMSADPYLNSAGISNDWPFGRGIYISSDQTFLIWVGEEDHLRIMVMKRGSKLSDVSNKLNECLHIVSEIVPFARSDRLGYVTSCPSNIGTGMRASVHLVLPNLSDNGQNEEALKKLAKELNLSVRGAGGEHTAAGAGGLFDISPSARFGVTEGEVMNRLFDGISKLLVHERNAFKVSFEPK